MRLYYTKKDWEKIHINTANSKKELKKWLSILIFKTIEDIDVILFNPNELQYWKVIQRESWKSKVFVKSWILDTNMKNGKLIESWIIPQLVDKQYKNEETNGEEIADLCHRVEISLLNILGK